MAAQRYPSLDYRQQGFTLVELIMVIVVMGVIGGTVAVFMRSPIDAYFQTVRRGGIADMADTTVRRMARDIRKALPNSIRLSGTQCIEFIPTRTGGRYRADRDTLGSGDILDFATLDTSFDVLGDTGTAAVPVEERMVAADLLAVYNLGIPGVDAYNLDNVALVKSTTPGAVTSTVAFTGDTTNIASVVGKKFPLASASSRFHVIPGDERIVSYICSGGKLYRNSNYAYTTSCPAPTAGTTPVIANEATCAFNYDSADIRNGLVQLNLTFSNATAGETTSVYHEVHVNNTP